MQIVHLRSVRGIGLQVALRQIRDLLEDGETSIFITNGDMSIPPSLDGPGSARSTDPETAHEAAAMNKPLSKRRRQVLSWLMDNGPAIGDDIADALGIDRSWVTPRLSELVVRYDPPLAYKTGRTFTNPKSNRPNEEWDATEIGKIWIRGESEQDG
jgi:hypothetical protein